VTLEGPLEHLQPEERGHAVGLRALDDRTQQFELMGVMGEVVVELARVDDVLAARGRQVVDSRARRRRTATDACGENECEPHEAREEVRAHRCTLTPPPVPVSGNSGLVDSLAAGCSVRGWSGDPEKETTTDEQDTTHCRGTRGDARGCARTGDRIGV
jgi:hypothetical protein